MRSDVDSIYRPPESDVERPPEWEGEFGSLERAIHGDFSLDIGEVMSEAWALTRGSKGVILAGYAVYYLVFSAATQAVSAVVDAGGGGQPGLLDFALQMGSGLVVYLIMAGIMIYAIKRSVGDASAGFLDIFSCLPMVLATFGLWLLGTLATTLGFLLLVLPGIYLSVAYALALPVLVDKRIYCRNSQGELVCLDVSR